MGGEILQRQRVGYIEKIMVERVAEGEVGGSKTCCFPRTASLNWREEPQSRNSLLKWADEVSGDTGDVDFKTLRRYKHASVARRLVSWFKN